MGASAGTIHADFPDDLSDCIRARLRMGQNPVPGSIASPTVESVSAGLPRTVAVGQITPRHTRAQLPQDSVDHRPVVAPLPATLPLTPREQRCDGVPRLLRQLASSSHSIPILCLVQNEGNLSRLIRQASPAGTHVRGVYAATSTPSFAHPGSAASLVSTAPALMAGAWRAGCFRLLSRGSLT